MTRYEQEFGQGSSLGVRLCSWVLDYRHWLFVLRVRDRMHEFRSALELVSGYLNSKRIEYAIVGGVAVMFHGVPRTTVDIDIILDIGEDEIKPLVEFLNSHGFVASVEDMEAALGDDSHCTVFFGDSLLRLDIQGVNTEFDKLKLERAIRVDLLSSDVRLGSAEDTLINKILFQGGTGPSRCTWHLLTEGRAA
jgi:hypothetical protein